jgi:hypothetical protein
VTKFPKPDLKKPPKIIKIPASSSEIATKDPKNGLKLKYSINFCGGSGNLLNPCIIKAIPSDALRKKIDIK